MVSINYFYKKRIKSEDKLYISFNTVSCRTVINFVTLTINKHFQ